MQALETDQALKTFIEERFANIHHRQLMVISGAEVWCLNVVEQLINLRPENNLNDFSILSCNADLPSGSNFPATNNGQYRHHLGREYDWVIYNGWRGVRANALAGLVGTVKSNGLFILLCPDFAQWYQYKDAEIEQRVSFGAVDKLKSSSFIRHLIGEIEEHTNCLLINEKGVTGCNLPVPPDAITSTLNIDSQNEVIQKIKKVALGHRKRPLIITADRGRGKSAALGIAAAQLAADENKQIIVTAPQKSSVETLFRHARISYSKATDNLKFFAIDDLIANEPNCDLLMVDEAAAVPVKLLIRLTERYARIAFTTTVNGYEGSGRGFEIRFKSWLMANRPEAKFATLMMPFRWFEQDPLELFWWKALHLKPLLKDEFTDADIDSVNLPTLRFEEINKDSLVQNKHQTNQIFSLLVNAHYQTTPDDFVAMLDAPEQKLFVAYHQHEDNPKSIIGVLLVNLEGNISDEILSTNIIKGQRRVQGHMLPQQLAFSSCDRSFLTNNYLRIVRIAVTEKYRLAGIGSHLLKELSQWAENHQIDYIGSSFGANTELASFWLKNQFNPVLLGFHRDKATAEYNLSVLKPVQNDVASEAIMYRLANDLRASLLFHLSDIYTELENDLVVLLLHQTLHSNTDIVPLSGVKKRKLEWFSHGNRSLEHTGPTLAGLFDSELIYTTLSPSEIGLLVDYLLKRKTIKELVALYQLDGQKGLLKVLKEALAKLLAG